MIMVKRFAFIFMFLVLATVLFSQEVPVEQGSLLTAGKSATLGVEASTAFAYDIDNNSTGLETKAGMELIFPLFPNADRGLYPDNYDTPAVRLALKNASFTWWNRYSTNGGNYEQDDFNEWRARPLVLTFDSFSADLVWKNFFFRVASSTTIMQTDQVSLFSIFDDVMDAGDRWYIRRGQTAALWTAERYNIQQLPLLQGKVNRNFIDEDYRPLRTRMSGIIAAGMEFEKINFAVKAGSRNPGYPTADPVRPANTENAWVFGADLELLPFENFTVAATGFAGINYEKTDVLKNPLNFGILTEYRLPLSERYFITPKAGFDFAMDTNTDESEWELGTGVLFHTRGSYVTSSRVLDRAEVIPVGASLSVNMNQDNVLNMMLSWFEPADKNAMLPNFGGFIQFELSDLLGNGSGLDYAALVQIEYLIAEKVAPYIRGGYMPVFKSGSTVVTTGDYLIKGVVGFYITPVHFFSIDICYEMNLVNGDVNKNLFTSVFTIRM
jgi:hypothetical protein